MKKIILYFLLIQCIGLSSIRGQSLVIVFKKKEPEIKIRYDRQVERGAEATLKWTVNNAEKIVFEGIPGEFGPEGEIKIKPDTTSTYSIIAYGKGDVFKKKKFTIQVYLPEIVHVSFPDTVSDEDSFTYSWRVENARYVTVSGLSDSLPLKGSGKMLLDSARDFTLTAHSEYNKVSVTKHVHVRYVEFLAGSKSVYRGLPLKIYWKFKNTKYVAVEGRPEQFMPVDTVKLMPLEDTVYNILVYRENGDVKKVKHAVRVLSPTIKVLYIPTYIKKGETVTLYWNTLGAKFAVLNGDTVAPVGRMGVKIVSDTAFRLVIWDLQQPIEKVVKVRLLPDRPMVVRLDSITEFFKNSRIDCDIIAVDNSNFPKEVKLHVLVVDTNGAFVGKLAPPYNTNEFAKKIFKSVVEQVGGKSVQPEFTIREISRDTSRFDFSLVLDHSGSMQGLTDMLQQGAEEFIRRKYKTDRVSVVKFDHLFKLMTELEVNPDKILEKAEFNGLDGFGGMTSLYASADEGVMSLSASENKKIMIVFTDGYENSSFYYSGDRAFTARQLADHIRRYNIEAYFISYGYNVNVDVLERLAALSGGKFYHLSDPTYIKNVFYELPRVFRNYYEITFKPQSIEGERTYKLLYDNQKGTIVNTKIKNIVGGEFSINEFQNDHYQYLKKYNPKNKNILSPPQVVARFEFDKDELKIEYCPAIDSYIEYLLKNPSSEIVILGHTDSKGSDAYCYELSLRRSQEVMDYIMQKGIARERMSVMGCGKDNMIWVPDTEPWQSSENRRVEILLLE